MADIVINHPNGFSGIIYGNSMRIWGPDDFYLHTYNRNPDIKTNEDLYKHLEGMPDFIRLLVPDTDHYDNDMDEAERQGYFDE